MNLSTAINPKLLQQATDHLSHNDPVLALAIAQFGPCTITPHTDYYQALGSSIIGQQLSVKAAATIKKRFCDLFDGTFPEPEQILTRSVDELRASGLSRGKAMYIQDLAQHIISGKISFKHIDDMSNDEIVAMLTDVKGIGVWTVHMFLMFCMGRPNILAVGDLGIRSGIRNLYGLSRLPTPQEVTDIATEHKWAPYETVACWYIWRSLDNEPATV